jgi:integrase/recombinase XerD
LAQIELNHVATLQPIDRDLRDFLIDRRARNLTPASLSWYTRSLNIWRTFLAEQAITHTESIDAGSVRRFLVWLTVRGHSAGGAANIYGAVKAFLKWYGSEYAPADWSDPLAHVKSPKRPDVVLEPLNLAHFTDMLKTCTRKTPLGDRDRALLLVLLDTGLRHQELTDLTISDIDLNTGAILVRSGKGRTWRTVFMGATTRRALTVYLHYRSELAPGTPLWMTRSGTPLTRAGILQVVLRRARQAGVPRPGMHDFRRAFAVNYLRNGGDVATLQRLLGHTDLRVINRYLKLLNEDLQHAHEQYGPVDMLRRRDSSK